MPNRSLPKPSSVVSALSLLVRCAPTGWKFFNRAILFRRQYDVMDDVPDLDGLIGTWAGAREITFIDQHPEATSCGANARRVARGDRCMCLKRGDEVLGYQWVTQGSACVFCGFDPDYELLFFPLHAHQVFTYDSYVYSDHRRKGYGTIVRRMFHKALRSEGVQEAYSLVAPENTASIGITLQSRFEPWRMAYGFRIHHWTKMILGSETDPQLRHWIDDFKAHSGVVVPRRSHDG